METQEQIESRMKDLYLSVYDEPDYVKRSPALRIVSQLVALAMKFDAITVLDAGCATGRAMKVLLEEGYEAYGIDITLKGVDKEIKDKYGDRLIEAPLSDIPTDQVYDFIYCVDVLEHIYPELLERSLQELRRVSSGTAFFQLPTFQHRVIGVDLHFLKTQKDWVDLIGKYFNVVHVCANRNYIGIITNNEDTDCDDCRMI
jgi:SAM-dependent methyltransferase